MVRFVLSTLLVAFLAGCGGGSEKDPLDRIPDERGVRAAVARASQPNVADFPSADGRTLREVESEVKLEPELTLASSVFTTPGPSPMMFGMLTSDGSPVYGPTVVYVAPGPDEPVEGPFPAPADLLLTEPRYRSEQAARTEDPFVAVYSADVEFARDGKYTVLAATKREDGELVGATATITVTKASDDRIPGVGDKAPRVHTDTLESAKGDVTAIDTRRPPSDMHDEDFADVVGKKPVALLFATPQLCQSLVCGPVTDIQLQMKAKYGDRMTFIHQEVWVDNDGTKGVRQPLKEFNLPTEPWLFVVNKKGRITARLEGSIGIKRFEEAVKSGL
jgi:hypothetical protein